MKSKLLSSLIISVLASFLISSVHAENLKIGEAAPDFTAKDIEGTTISSKDLHGKITVLEWFSPACHFVRAHYKFALIQRLQKEFREKGVNWYLIASIAPGKPGYNSNQGYAETLSDLRAHPNAMLLDPDGKIAKQYGTLVTPQVFIMDKDWKLAYSGAFDDAPSVEVQDKSNAKNYVAQALEEMVAGKPVSIPQTEPYGCAARYD